MNKNNCIIFVLFCCLLTSLSCKKKIKNRVPEIIFLDSTMNLFEVYKRTAVKLERHQLKNIDTVLQSAKGTIFTIRKNTIVDENGLCPREFVMEYSEYYNPIDQLLSNMQTLSTKGVLETGGMLFVNFKTTDGKQLALKASKTIKIEVPTENLDSEMQLFVSERANDGSIVWETSKSNRLKKELTLMSIDEERMKSFFSSVDTVGKLNQIRKSFISTVEFQYSFRPELSCAQIYLDGALDGKDLFVVDSIVREVKLLEFEKLAKRFKINIKGLDQYQEIIILKEYQKLGLTKPRYIETYGVNLESIDAFEKLVLKGLSEFDAQTAIDNHKRAKLAKQSNSNNRKLNYVFEAAHFGFYNIDKFLNNSNFISLEIDVNIENYSKIDDANVFCVYKNFKTLLKFKKEGNKFVVNDNNVFPPGEEVKLVVVGFKGNAMYAGINKFITSKDKIKVNLKLQLTDEIGLRNLLTR